MSESFQGLFKSKYPDLQGRDWINQLSVEDRKVFTWIWQRSHEFGHLGGLARARSAKRDNRGRFASNGS
ncbi:MAG: hypothetical protein ACYTFW_20805 [Planctomycetota bacterium]|jgi:hypothetical protein